MDVAAGVSVTRGNPRRESAGLPGGMADTRAARPPDTPGRAVLTYPEAELAMSDVKHFRIML